MNWLPSVLVAVLITAAIYFAGVVWRAPKPWRGYRRRDRW